MPVKLQQAITDIRNGDRDRGKRLLAEVLIQDPGQEVAWLLMAEIVDYDEHRRYCLEQVLRLNPSNQLARDRLGALQRDHLRQDHPVQLSMEGVPSPEGQVEAEKRSDTALTREKVGAETPVVEATGGSIRASARRRSPILIIVALLVTIGGMTLFFLTAPTILSFSLDPQAHLLGAPDILRNLLLMVLGAALIIAGLAGVWWMLGTSSERPPALRQRRSDGSRRQEPQSDHLDAGLWLDTGAVDEQKTGIRLF